jgi:Flp pilus assembly protein TadG
MEFPGLEDTSDTAAHRHTQAGGDEDTAMRKRRSARRGSTMIEFSLVALLLMITIFASFEFDRMVLAYTSLAHAARAGVRYAIVHGSNRTGTGDPPSGPGNTINVETVVKNFARTGTVDPATLAVAVAYPGGNTPGSLVTITVTFPYHPFTTILPLNLNLTSTTQGIIVF